MIQENKSGTLATHNDQTLFQPCNINGNDIAETLDAHYYLGCGSRGGKEREVVCMETGKDKEGSTPEKDSGYVVRRLTPLECERLQGFPDHWTDIGDWVDGKGKTRQSTDSMRYKALGNSIALPFWQWLAYRMVWQLKKDGVEHPTMGSLFDGIGGFPLVYTRAGCEPIWNSEIEEFCEAVTRKRFL